MVTTRRISPQTSWAPAHPAVRTHWDRARITREVSLPFPQNLQLESVFSEALRRVTYSPALPGRPSVPAED